MIGHAIADLHLQTCHDTHPARTLFRRGKFLKCCQCVYLGFSGHPPNLILCQSFTDQYALRSIYIQVHDWALSVKSLALFYIMKIYRAPMEPCPSAILFIQSPAWRIPDCIGAILLAQENVKIVFWNNQKKMIYWAYHRLVTRFFVIE